MEVERLWGKYPGWFGEQDRHVQTRLLAHYRVHVNPRGKSGGQPGTTGRRPKNVRVANDAAAGFWGVE